MDDYGILQINKQIMYRFTILPAEWQVYKLLRAFASSR